MIEEKEILRILAALKEAPEKIDESTWMEYSCHEEEIKNYLEQKFLLPNTSAHDFNIQYEYQQLIDKLHINIPDNRNTKEGRTIDRLIYFLSAYKYQITALFSFLLVGICYYYISGDKKASVQNHEMQSASYATILFDTISNYSSEYKKVKLSDGTYVILNSNSFISFKRNFNKEYKRSIYLNGSARFHVKDGKIHPFSVYVKNLEIQDLGTIFSIKSVNTNIQVHLLKGKVALKPVHTLQNKTIVLSHAGQSITWNNSEGTFSFPSISKPNVSIKDLDTLDTIVDFESMKLEKKFFFKNEPLNSVFDSISTQLKGITIAFDKTDISGKTFSGNINSGSDVQSTINMICTINDLHCSYERHRIIIRK